jgi:hypothetical protein
MKPLTSDIIVPDSVLPRPKKPWSRAEYIFWKIISHWYLATRNTLLALHIIYHHGRQGYLLGRLRNGRTLPGFLSHLETRGFGNHFIAWTDDGQIVSMRKLHGFNRQYHLRIFKDGEIRGHYEYTPESHPIWHMKEVGMEERHEEFMGFLKDWVVKE